MTGRVRTAVLISGRGSNMRALVDAARSPDFPADIVGVISNKVGAAGLEFARSAGIETAVHLLRNYPDRTEADAAMTATLEKWNVEIVCLAGFMRILSDRFTTRWAGRLINVHPSLLPAFRGLDTHRRALEAGMREHGCSVHFVVPELDAGPVIAQAHVPVRPDDDAEILAARVLEQEHKIYPLALREVARGRVRLVQNRARWFH